MVAWTVSVGWQPNKNTNTIIFYSDDFGRSTRIRVPISTAMNWASRTASYRIYVRLLVWISRIWVAVLWSCRMRVIMIGCLCTVGILCGFINLWCVCSVGGFGIRGWGISCIQRMILIGCFSFLLFISYIFLFVYACKNIISRCRLQFTKRTLKFILQILRGYVFETL